MKGVNAMMKCVFQMVGDKNEEVREESKEIFKEIIKLAPKDSNIIEKLIYRNTHQNMWKRIIKLYTCLQKGSQNSKEIEQKAITTIEKRLLSKNLSHFFPTFSRSLKCLKTLWQKTTEF